MSAELLVHEAVVIVLGGALATVIQRTPLADAWKQAAVTAVGLVTLVSCLRVVGLV